MELSKVIEKRVTTKEFVKFDIPEADLNEILEASRWAPTGLGAEQTRAIVILNQDIKAEISDMFLGSNAPKIINSSAVILFTGQGKETLSINNWEVLKSNMSFLDLTNEKQNLLLNNVIIGSYESGSARIENLATFAAASKISYFTLKATDLGYDTAIMTGINFDKLENHGYEKGWLLKGETVVAAVTIGKADENSEWNKNIKNNRNRKEFSNYVKYIK